MVARYWKQLSSEFGRNDVMIVSIDKDYKQFLLSFLQVQIDELSDKNEQIEILYEQKEVA